MPPGSNDSLLLTAYAKRNFLSRLHIPIQREHRPGLMSRVERMAAASLGVGLSRREFALPTGRIEMDAMEGVLWMRHDC